jgi:hypothetical protein
MRCAVGPHRFEEVHRLVFAGVGLDLGSVDGHMTRPHQTRRGLPAGTYGSEAVSADQGVWNIRS